MRSLVLQVLLAFALGSRSGSIGAQHSDVEIRTILQKVLAHEPALDKQLERFEYTETVKTIDNGKQKSVDTYEVSFYRGRKVRRLIKRNERVEKQIKNLEAGNIPPLGNRRVKLDDLLHCSIFSNVQETQVSGRDVWTSEFHPNPRIKPANINEKFVHNLDGKLAVDPAALQLVSFEFVLRDAFKIAGGLWFAMKPGTHFIDREDWQFSKIWLPELHEFDMNAKAMIGVKLLIDEITTYSAYKEFAVAVHDSVAILK